MIQYKGYYGRVEFDDEAERFHGEIVGIRDVVTFQGRSVRELKRAFRDSVEDYLEFCAQRGQAPEKPCSGTLSLRLGPELHRKVSLAADLDGKSINRWIAEHLEQNADKALNGGD